MADYIEYLKRLFPGKALHVLYDKALISLDEAGWHPRSLQKAKYEKELMGKIEKLDIPDGTLDTLTHEVKGWDRTRKARVAHELRTRVLSVTHSADKPSSGIPYKEEFQDIEALGPDGWVDEDEGLPESQITTQDTQ